MLLGESLLPPPSTCHSARSEESLIPAPEGFLVSLRLPRNHRTRGQRPSRSPFCRITGRPPPHTLTLTPTLSLKAREGAAKTMHLGCAESLPGTCRRAKPLCRGTGVSPVFRFIVPSARRMGCAAGQSPFAGARGSPLFPAVSPLFAHRMGCAEGLRPSAGSVRVFLTYIFFFFLQKKRARVSSKVASPSLRADAGAIARVLL